MKQCSSRFVLFHLRVHLGFLFKCNIGRIGNHNVPLLMKEGFIIPLFKIRLHKLDVSLIMKCIFTGYLEGVCGYIHTAAVPEWPVQDRKSTRLNSSHVAISYA